MWRGEGQGKRELSYENDISFRVATGALQRRGQKDGDLWTA
jgi:hypothetical protein